MHADTTSDGLHALPLWAQVLLASRVVRRAAVSILDDVAGSPRARILAACDALDRCVQRGGGVPGEREALRRARDWQPTVDLHQVSLGIQSVIAAAEAAEASFDIGAAESACTRSAAAAIGAITQGRHLESGAVERMASSERTAIALACARAGLGRYDPVPASMSGTLPPIEPWRPDMPCAPAMGDRP